MSADGRNTKMYLCFILMVQWSLLNLISCGPAYRRSSSTQQVFSYSSSSNDPYGGASHGRTSRAAPTSRSLDGDMPATVGPEPPQSEPEVAPTMEYEPAPIRPAETSDPGGDSDGGSNENSISHFDRMNDASKMRLIELTDSILQNGGDPIAALEATNQKLVDSKSANEQSHYESSEPEQHDADESEQQEAREQPPVTDQPPPAESSNDEQKDGTEQAEQQPADEDDAVVGAYIDRTDPNNPMRVTIYESKKRKYTPFGQQQHQQVTKKTTSNDGNSYSYHRASSSVSKGANGATERTSHRIVQKVTNQFGTGGGGW